MTIKEIAAMCGVSRGTVDRVLNHRGRVKPETEQAVRAALEQAGYTKNIAGRALTVRRLAPRIGVVLCCLGNPFFDECSRAFPRRRRSFRIGACGWNCDCCGDMTRQRSSRPWKS